MRLNRIIAALSAILVVGGLGAAILGDGVGSLGIALAFGLAMIVAVVAAEAVIAVGAEEGVVAIAAKECVVAIGAVEGGVAGLTEEGVITIAAGEGVVAIAAVNEGGDFFAGNAIAHLLQATKKGAPAPPLWSVETLLNLRDTGQRPATAAVARLDHVPDLVERLRRRVEFLADESGEAHADDVAGALLGHIEDLGIDRHDVGLLGGLAAFGETQLDLAEHFRRREFTDVFKVAGIVSCLQANEIHLGIADEAIDIEAGRNVPTGAAGSRQ